ncbi:hypothetical protein CEP51_014449 [Fusarium floridanum]|uniref:Uncharacterized protein n=1 Tax=Fusarium floridanum TaxID=1325733 RepID=A0A428PSM3_9HYPO|nr:hypothetical protein CEP51_014449 [Fusarium floridanum]
MSLPRNLSTRLRGGGLMYIPTDQFGKATGSWAPVTAELRAKGVDDVPGAYEWLDPEQYYKKFSHPTSATEPIYDVNWNQVG